MKRMGITALMGLVCGCRVVSSPPAPQSQAVAQVAAAPTLTSATLAWGAASGAAGYELQWSENNGLALVLATSGTSARVTSLVVGKIYQFNVRATNAAGASAWSAPVRWKAAVWKASAQLMPIQ